MATVCFPIWSTLLLLIVVRGSHGFNTSTRQQIESLSKVLRLIYQEGGTLGVLKRSQGMTDFGPDTLVSAAMKASQGDRGMASGILNGFLGSCCAQEGDSSSRSAALAIDLMKAYDKLDHFDPVLVALALAFSATDGTQNQEQADEFLRRAEQLHGHQPTTSTPCSHSPDWNELEQTHGIHLLQESNDFVVVSKPSGMVCYHTTKPSPKKKRKRKMADVSLEACILQSGVPLSTLNLEGRGIVHRLDRGTSGCIVLTKTNRMHAHMMAQFFLRTVQKSYQALICPSTRLLVPNQGTVDLDINGRPATSNYKVEKELGSIVKRIRINTQQGRRHQVRIHCSQGLHAPILMDSVYGGQRGMSSNLRELKPSLVRLKAKNQFCLHAESLCILKFDIHVKAPLPEWWCQLEESLTTL